MKPALAVAALVLGVGLSGCSKPAPVFPSATSSSTVSPSPLTGSASALPTPSASGAEPAAGDVVRLSANAPLQRPPVWGVPKSSEWTATVLDRDGVNEFAHADGCRLTTFQSVTEVKDVNGAKATDANATEAYLTNYLQRAQQDGREFVAGPIRSLPLAVGLEGNQQVEFAAVDYARTSVLTGERTQGLVAARVMVAPGGQLQATLTCPDGLLDKHRSVIAALKVMIR